MQDAARTGRTTHPKLAAIYWAGEINRRSGGALVAPWEIDEIPDEWIEAYQALDELPQIKKEQDRLEQYFVQFRNAHPTYHKHLN